jgi:UDP-N-acetylglucosamine 2-epimerase (non-hydrolysing)
MGAAIGELQHSQGAPSFEVPVLVLRELTERAEALEAGCARLVGIDRQRIVDVTGRLLSNERSWLL